eukprot:SAG31_NODE_2000_length_6694_cov_13.828658_2_plen_228_part_00
MIESIEDSIIRQHRRESQRAAPESARNAGDAPLGFGGCRSPRVTGTFVNAELAKAPNVLTSGLHASPREPMWNRHAQPSTEASKPVIGATTDQALASLSSPQSSQAGVLGEQGVTALWRDSDIRTSQAASRLASNPSSSLRPQPPTHKPPHPTLRLSSLSTELPLDELPDFSGRASLAQMMERIELLAKVWEHRKQVAADMRSDSQQVRCGLAPSRTLFVARLLFSV